MRKIISRFDIRSCKLTADKSWTILAKSVVIVFKLYECHGIIVWLRQVQSWPEKEDESGIRAGKKQRRPPRAAESRGAMLLTLGSSPFEGGGKVGVKN
jgi:hypothetical protein